MTGNDPLLLQLPGEIFHLKKKLGQGQFGAVWQAEAPGGVPVAVKIIERTLKSEEAEREFKALQVVKELRHSFLLSLQAFFSMPDRLIIVLELADKNLRQYLEEQQKAGRMGIPPEELLDFIGEAADALDYLHRNKVQHRDIKPANMLLLGRHVKVADCGLARLVDALQTASRLGTPAYMAPEVWNDEVHPNSDQYSLAVSYVELRQGKFPFAGNNMAKLMFAHLQSDPDLTALEPEEQEVVRRALSKEPGQRYPSCCEFTTALEKALAGKEAPSSPPALLVAVPPPPRNSEFLGTADSTPSGSRLTLVESNDRLGKSSPLDTVNPGDPHCSTGTEQPPSANWHPQLPQNVPIFTRRLGISLAALLTILLVAYPAWRMFFAETDKPPLPVAKEDLQNLAEPEPFPAKEKSSEPADKEKLSEQANLEKQIQATWPETAPASERLKEPLEKRIKEMRWLRNHPLFSHVSKDLQDKVHEGIQELEQYLEYQKAFPISPPDLSAVHTQREMDEMERLLKRLNPPAKYEMRWKDAELVWKQQGWSRELQALRQATTINLDLGSNRKIKLVRIEPGKFTMGSPKSEEGRDADEDQHVVDIPRSFFLGVHEVTQGQYRRIMDDNPSFNQGDDLPVEKVIWSDAVEFCRRVSALPEPKAKGWIIDLPTEAEWEYCCRAGMGTSFSIGETLYLEQANFSRDDPKTMKAGSYPANAWGLHDMHGNVWEWCKDWYQKEYYAESPVRDPQGPESGTYRVVRGGAWGSNSKACRCAYRQGSRPDSRSSDVGFRVVLRTP